MKSFLKKITKYDKWNNLFNSLLAKADNLSLQQQELLMAHKYHDTIADYEWLKYKGISPGGWAVDYGFCYTLVRILNTMRPENILECGLGQSSRLIHQYASFYNKKAITCEHDASWVDFFEKEIGKQYPINIKSFELEKITYKGAETLTYKTFSNSFNNEQFDLLLIDGPFGSEHFSRPQAIQLSHDNLADSFCILMDDTERTGEQETIEEIKHNLSDRGIDYHIRTYANSKSHTIICSSDLAFLTTL